MIWIILAFLAGFCVGSLWVAWLAVREERAMLWRVPRPLGWRMRRWFG